MLRLAMTSLLLFASVSFADDSDRRHKYKDAAHLGDEKTRDQLSPNMLQHYMQASMKFMSGDIAGGMAEQTKGDQLKQQIQENKKSADKNREREKLVMDGPNDVRQQQLKGDPRVLTVDKDRTANQPAANAEIPTENFVSSPTAAFSYDAATATRIAAEPVAPTPAEASRPATAEQLAQISDSSAAPLSVASAAVEPPALPGSAANVAITGGIEAPRSVTADVQTQLEMLGAATGVLDKRDAAGKQAKADAAFFAGVGKEDAPTADGRAPGRKARARARAER